MLRNHLNSHGFTSRSLVATMKSKPLFMSLLQLIGRKKFLS